jgi:hypothetical protein
MLLRSLRGGEGDFSLRGRFVETRSFGEFVLGVDGKMVLRGGEGDPDFDIQKEEFCQRKESRVGPETQSIHRE